MGVRDLEGVDDALIERLADAVAGRLSVVQPRNTLTWEQLWELYRESEAEKLESWSTVEGRAKHVVRIIGGEVVSDAGLHTIKRYRGVRRGETTIRKGLTTATTRNREIELILRMARWASRQKPPHLPINPFAGLERGDLFEAVENIRRNIVEDDPGALLSLANLLEGADLFDRATVLVGHSSGMRRKELALLERAWIDRNERLIEIPPGVSKGRRGRRPGRQTFISQEAIDAIDAYHESLPFPWRYRSPYVFCNPKNGDHYEPGYFSVRFRELARRRQFVGPSGPVWLHDAGRRSFITLHRRRGEDTSNIRAASGHKTLKAFERYDIHARKDAIVVRDRIEAARERELSSLASQRRGPQRIAVESNDSVAVDKIRKP
jgi:integrase